MSISELIDPVRDQNDPFKILKLYQVLEGFESACYLVETLGLYFPEKMLNGDELDLVYYNYGTFEGVDYGWKKKMLEDNFRYRFLEWVNLGYVSHSGNPYDYHRGVIYRLKGEDYIEGKTTIHYIREEPKSRDYWLGITVIGQLRLTEVRLIRNKSNYISIDPEFKHKDAIESIRVIFEDIACNHPCIGFELDL